MQASMTAQLVADALVMAVWRRGKPDALLQLDQVELSYRRQLEATELCGLGVVGAINHQIEDCWLDEQRKYSLWQLLAADAISRLQSCRWNIFSNYKGMRRAEMETI